MDTTRAPSKVNRSALKVTYVTHGEGKKGNQVMIIGSDLVLDLSMQRGLSTNKTYIDSLLVQANIE